MGNKLVVSIHPASPAASTTTISHHRCFQAHLGQLATEGFGSFYLKPTLRLFKKGFTICRVRIAEQCSYQKHTCITLLKLLPGRELMMANRQKLVIHAHDVRTHSRKKNGSGIATAATSRYIYTSFILSHPGLQIDDINDMSKNEPCPGLSI